MKYRINQLIILFLGISSSALLLYGLFVLIDLFSGIPLSDLITSLHQSVNGFIAFMGSVANGVGLGSWWQHTLLPGVDAAAQWAFTYWWAGFYLLSWVSIFPVVITVYYITNLFVRMLGYKVAPFPGGILGRLLHRWQHWSIRLIPQNSIRKPGIARGYVREIRRQAIARYREKS